MVTSDERVNKLENRLSFLVGGGLVLIVSVGTFFGVAKYDLIPTAVNETIISQVREFAPDEIKKILPKEIQKILPKEIRETLSKEIRETLPKEIRETLLKEIQETLPKNVNDILPNAIDNFLFKQSPILETTLSESLDRATKSALDAEENAHAAQIATEKINILLEKYQELLGKDLNIFAKLIIETGTVRINKTKFPDLGKTDECPQGPEGRRGALNFRQDFKKDFELAPEMMVALNYLSEGHREQNNIRIETKVEVKHIDKEGFNFDLFTWCDTHLWGAGMSWVAYGY